MSKNKTKILWWVIALLATFNITTIATIVVNNYHHKESIILAPEVCPINGKYFRSELGFDDGQMQVFTQSNRIFRNKASQVITDINFQKELMFEELQTANPDTVKLNVISKEIGLLHADLKEATGLFYMSLAKVCNIEQKEKMKIIFTPLFIDLPERYGRPGCVYEKSNDSEDIPER